MAPHEVNHDGGGMMVAIGSGLAMVDVHVRRKVTGKLTPDEGLHAPRDGYTDALASPVKVLIEECR